MLPKEYLTKSGKDATCFERITLSSSYIKRCATFTRGGTSLKKKKNRNNGNRDMWKREKPIGIREIKKGEGGNW